MSEDTKETISVVLWGYGIICAIVLFFSLMLDSNGSMKYATTPTVASQAFGLESGKEYPFRYGKRIEGSIGYAKVRSGLFSSSASVNLQPASSLSVNYQYGNSSYILELPVERIRFEQTTERSPSIKITLEADYYDELEEYSRSIGFVGVPYIKQPDRPLEENSWFKELKSEGQLGPLVRESLRTAIITLPPEDYSKILGG